ncbi:MATH and LRR domain-containing protein PFE0570w-like [Pararge aegeria]|uniref:MATH and LRR domain-containing protein PFE0570w-like n=1 Tax=Pararge aegeria TaxID=116150 RepID=UPI0019D26BB0|nr:MATH and LRR domain-containing protein PFE0570w-like [Pararge aegeria]
MNQVIDENFVKVVQRLPFDVVAVPQNNTSGILDKVTNAPVNIKIKVRNKEATTGRHEVISVPKLSTSGPKKVRLVSSDQTIISFDLFMEKESENKVSKKPHHKFLQIFKHRGCFNNKNHDDVYSYVPSSSSEIYRAKSTSVDDLHENKIFEKKYALKKNTPDIINNNTTLRRSTFLGKCKPGGCLDPPFSEDKYIYKPNAKLLALEQKYIENHRVTDDCNNDKTNSDIVADNPDSVLPPMLNKYSIEKVYSHSLITYPPALPSSQIDVQEDTQNRKSKIRTSFENKVRISMNEFSDTYFMPPKKRKSKINGNLDTEFRRSQILKSHSYDAKNSLSNQKEPTQLSAMPTKVLYTNSNGKSHKISVIDNDATCSKLSNTNLENLNVRCSVFDKRGSDAVSSLNYKKAITTEDMPSQSSQTSINKIMHTIADKPYNSQENLNKENQGSSLLFYNTDEYEMNKAPQDCQAYKNNSISNGTLNKSKIIHKIIDNPLDNQSVASQRQPEFQLPPPNKDLVSDFANTDKKIIKSEHALSTDDNKNKPTPPQDYENSKNKSIFIETLNQSKNMHEISGEELEPYLALENQYLESDPAYTDENIIKFEHDLNDDKIKNKRSSLENKGLKNKSISHETLNQLKLMHGISNELLNNQQKLQMVEENQDLRSHFTNTNEKIITQDQDQASEEENRSKLNLMNKIPDVATDNYSLTSPKWNKLQFLEENQNLRPNFTNTDDNMIKFERDLTSDKNSLIAYIPGTESLRQESFTETANLLHNSDHTKLKQSDHSQLSVKENTQNREIIKQDSHQTKLEDKVSTISTIDKEKCANSSFVTEESNKIESKYSDRAISISTVNNADETQLAYQNSVRLLSVDLISSIINAKPKVANT